ncbi:MAG: 1-acyl-sn-glycerol-3-phosphate acyltransferase [Gammaproteobacteria bacterium]|nr:1-acyl-sn-glycerol-3-phosphate acyltransferase [Gammaproteobacteria bacterium]MBQ0840819.1 1-acyl-sn-glycerol-3-phosphate acyltransferase [Gammaproteobacteria bacterium]
MTSREAPESTVAATVDAAHFDDIRPYNDDEFAKVFTRLIGEREFVDTLASMKFSRLFRWLPWLLRPLIRKTMRQSFADVRSVRDFQEIIGAQMHKLLDKDASQLTVRGLDKLDPKQSYLFISNHRDIAMDPALTILALHQNNMDSVRIAIGDNLLTKPFVSDLMRLNKSFIVRRSTKGRREKLAALKHLSAYIRFSLQQEHQSIWIAQREGRAKDGLDGTETALLKMLALCKAKTESFGEVIQGLNVVPVSLSYEWDPCDSAKAKELYAHQNEGAYEKAEHEDIASIYRGIVGNKGHIYVTFGDLLSTPFADAATMAAEIDRQIIGNYRLQATHWIAYERLHGLPEQAAQAKASLVADWQAVAQAFDERLEAIPQEHRDTLLAAYANPVVQYLQHCG